MPHILMKFKKETLLNFLLANKTHAHLPSDKAKQIIKIFKNLIFNICHLKLFKEQNVSVIIMSGKRPY